MVAALLGLVNQVTAPAIAANTEKTIQDSLKVVLPADSYEKVEYDGGDITLDTGTVVPVLAVYQPVKRAMWWRPTPPMALAAPLT